MGWVSSLTVKSQNFSPENAREKPLLFSALPCVHKKGGRVLWETEYRGPPENWAGTRGVRRENSNENSRGAAENVKKD